MIDPEAVARGFSRKAEVYDAYGESNPIVRWSRGRARQALAERLSPGASILELNAGTGADAAWFVERGFRVHATDLAGGMLAKIDEKIRASGQPQRFSAQACSLTDLAAVTGGPYQAVFSNFGGLNCLPDLTPVGRALPGLLMPGAWVVWVVMPPVCPWELAQLARGQWRTALRRLRPGGVLAQVAGARFMTYYHPARRAQAALGARFRLIEQRGLSLFCPPSYMENFPRRFPGLTRRLMALDERWGGRWPFNQWGDFLVLTWRYEPA